MTFVSQSRNRRRTRAQSHSPSFQLSGPRQASKPGSPPPVSKPVCHSGQSTYRRTHAPARPPPPTQQSPHTQTPSQSNRRAPSPPSCRLPISQLPSSHTPQPQALLRSILEHFLAQKRDLEAQCFNSLRCAVEFCHSFIQQQLYSTPVLLWVLLLPLTCHPFCP